MKEFMELIYMNWIEKNKDREFDYKSKTDIMEKLKSLLSEKVMYELEEAFYDCCLEVEERAFTSGFAHGVHCVSCGKVSLGYEEE